MPSLKLPSEKIERLYLPSTKDAPEEDKAWIDIDVGPFVTGDILALQDMNNPVIKVQAEILSRRIKDWNFTDADGSKTPIDYDSIARLEIPDFQFIVVELNKPSVSDDEQKKTLLGN